MRSANVSVTDDVSAVSITERYEQHLRSSGTGLPDGTIWSKLDLDWLNNYSHGGGTDLIWLSFLIKINSPYLFHLNLLVCKRPDVLSFSARR